MDILSYTAYKLDLEMIRVSLLSNINKNFGTIHFVKDLSSTVNN